MDAAESAKFEAELVWCMEQLAVGLASGKLTDKQGLSPLLNFSCFLQLFMYHIHFSQRLPQCPESPREPEEAPPAEAAGDAQLLRRLPRKDGEGGVQVQARGLHLLIREGRESDFKVCEAEIRAAPIVL